MEPLIIEATKGTPKVNLFPNGELHLEGRSLPEDPHSFFTPVLEWVKNFQGDKIHANIRLEYLNTSSSKQIYEFLSLIKAKTNLKELSINWYYEEGDDDAKETGKEFESLTKLTFTFHEFAESLN
jgi:hypothetical protein